MKKLLCVLLVLLMTVPVFGCSANTEPEIIENEAVFGEISSESSSFEEEYSETEKAESENSSSSESSEVSSEPESSSSSSSEKQEYTNFAFGYVPFSSSRFKRMGDEVFPDAISSDCQSISPFSKYKVMIK